MHTTTANDPFERADRIEGDDGVAPLNPSTLMRGPTEARVHHDRFCHLITHLYDARRNGVVLRDASLHVIQAAGRTFDDLAHDSSVDADVVFLGMAMPDEHDDNVSYDTRLRERTDGLPPTVVVLANDDSTFREVLI